MGLERCLLRLGRITEELHEWKVAAPRLTAVGIRCASRNTLYPQKLALTSPTSGGRLVGIVRLPTKATEFSVVFSGVPTAREI
jgi:hypothetical protein